MTASSIRRLRGWQALDSRGNATVACEVLLTDGSVGVATAPSGASTGRHEALELRDPPTVHGDRPVGLAVANVNGEIAAALQGQDVTDQQAIDDELLALDGTDGFHRLGANATLAVSVACALASAEHQRLPLYRALLGESAHVVLPMPMVNILSGGAHADRMLDFQDFLVVPVGASSFTEAIDWCSRVRRAAVALAGEAGLGASLVADEGGLGLALGSNRAALEFLSRAIDRSGLAPGHEAGIAVDVAASQFFHDGSYPLATEDRVLAAAGLTAELVSWCDEHPVVSLEDPLAEDDWEGWQHLTALLGDRVQVIGDDLFVTHADRLRRGITEKAGNAVLIKPNQRGTLSQSRQVLEQAKQAGFATIVSARSGETEESWLSDLAVGWDAGQIKVGSLMRSERSAKWNRLLRIESDPAVPTSFAGAGALSRVGRPGSRKPPGPTH